MKLFRKILYFLRRIKGFILMLQRRIILFLRFNIFGNKPIKIRFHDVSIFLKKRGAISKNIIHNERSVFNEISFVIGRMKGKRIFFDIGANVGIFSLIIGKMYPDAEVYAFEPTKETFKVLNENKRLNSIKNIKTFNIALSDYDGESEIFLNEPFQEGLNALRMPLRKDAKIIGKEKVIVKRLDTFIRENNIRNVDIIKADIEGCEMNLFKGAIDLLTSENPPLLYFESYSFNTKAFGYHPLQVIWFLMDIGYKIYALKKGELIIPNSFIGYDNMYVGIR